MLSWSVDIEALSFVGPKNLIPVESEAQALRRTCKGDIEKLHSARVVFVIGVINNQRFPAPGQRSDIVDDIRIGWNSVISHVLRVPEKVLQIGAFRRG